MKAATVSPSRVEGAAAAPGLRRLAAAVRVLARQPELRVLFGCNVLLGLTMSFVVPYLSMFGTLEVGMSTALFGAFMTTTTLANVCTSSLLSHLSDRLASRRRLLLVGAAAGSAGYAAYAVVRDPWLLLAVHVLLLGAAAPIFSQLFAHARERLGSLGIDPAEAPLYMNVYRMAYAASWTLGPALAALTLRRLGFAGLFAGAALFFSLLGATIWFGVPAAPAARSRTSPAPGMGTLALWRRPDVLPWFLGFVLIFAAQSISMSNMSLYVLRSLGGNEANVGVIFSLAPVFEVPFMLYVGLLATRVDSRSLIRLAMGLSVLYFGAVSLAQAPWHIYPLQVLSAAIIAVTSGIAITFFQDLVPGQLGVATNLYVITIRIGSTSGYVLFGAVTSGFGHRGAFVACTLLALVALLATRGRPVKSSAPRSGHAAARS